MKMQAEGKQGSQQATAYGYQMEQPSQSGNGRSDMGNAEGGNSSSGESQKGEDLAGMAKEKVKEVAGSLPSVGVWGVAMGALGLSALLHLSGRKEDSNFVGHWVPTILLMGVYKKLVKMEGSSDKIDKMEPSPAR